MRVIFKYDLYLGDTVIELPPACIVRRVALQADKPQKKLYNSTTRTPVI